jgi:hypothetical protein
MLLNGPGQAYVCRRLAPGMGEGTPIEQAEQAITPNAPQISPQPPIIDPGLVARLPQGPLACEHRANGLVTGEGVRVAHGVMDEEGVMAALMVAGHGDGLALAGTATPNVAGAWEGTWSHRIGSGQITLRLAQEGTTVIGLNIEKLLYGATY